MNFKKVLRKQFDLKAVETACLAEETRLQGFRRNHAASEHGQESYVDV